MKLLHEITDEHAIDVAKIAFNGQGNWVVKRGHSNIECWWHTDAWVEIKHSGDLVVGEDGDTWVLSRVILEMYDYLRSLGYHIPNAYQQEVDWDRVERVLERVKNLEVSVGTAIAYLKTIINS